MDLKAFCFIVLAGAISWACLCCAADSDHTQTMPRFRPSADYAIVETEHQAWEDGVPSVSVQADYFFGRAGRQGKHLWAGQCRDGVAVVPGQPLLRF